MKTLLRSFLVLVLVFPASQLFADEFFSGHRSVALLDSKGTRYEIGAVEFISQSGGLIDYQLHLDTERFSDHFLSMKELKCLEGAELWCRIPYPYPNPHIISAADLRWLEHDLLFLFKRNAEFGANFWNGIYYKLRLDQGVLLGQAQAIDLNELASPPDDLNVAPIGEMALEQADLEKRWLPTIEIR
ncbi:MAG: hypothetical protein V7752_05080 [Halopseudomonas sp.]